jgi:hypothetical protein
MAIKHKISVRDIVINGEDFLWKIKKQK